MGAQNGMQFIGLRVTMPLVASIQVLRAAQLVRAAEMIKNSLLICSAASPHLEHLGN